MRSKEQHLRGVDRLRGQLLAIPIAYDALVCGQPVHRYTSGYSIDRGAILRLDEVIERLRPARPAQPPEPIHRIVAYPEAGKEYLRSHRAILAHFAEKGPMARVNLTWTRRENLAGYKRAVLELLDRRINEAGGVVVMEPRDEWVRLYRDQQRLAAWPRGCSGFGWGLESKLAQRRFPEIHAAMLAHRRDPDLDVPWTATPRRRHDPKRERGAQHPVVIA